MLLELKCPRCGNHMLYSPKGSYHNKWKKCVFCGKNFKVSSHIVRVVKK